MEYSLEVVWVNGSPQVEAIHLTDINLKTLGVDIDRLKVSVIKDELFRTKLLQFKRSNPVHPVHGTPYFGDSAKPWYVLRAVDAILNNPEKTPQDAIIEECKVSRRTALNYISTLGHTIEYVRNGGHSWTSKIS